jgi:hypothetical protein
VQKKQNWLALVSAGCHTQGFLCYRRGAVEEIFRGRPGKWWQWNTRS